MRDVTVAHDNATAAAPAETGTRSEKLDVHVAELREIVAISSKYFHHPAYVVDTAKIAIRAKRPRKTPDQDGSSERSARALTS